MGSHKRPLRDSIRERLETIYARLRAHYGAPNWWPAASKWEIMVGAILTQNTAWTNVEKALTNLKGAGMLDAAQLRTIELAALTELVRPAGFTSTKPRRLKVLAEFLLREYGGDTANLRGGNLQAQRAQLLALYGIGPETADAILLYAAEQPIFVIDAYTQRILGRMGWVEGKLTYEALQSLFMAHLPHDVARFNDYHALLDLHAKHTCTKRAPRCGACPLNDICAKVGVVETRA